jgi:hypothetical protein
MIEEANYFISDHLMALIKNSSPPPRINAVILSAKVPKTDLLMGLTRDNYGTGAIANGRFFIPFSAQAIESLTSTRSPTLDQRTSPPARQHVSWRVDTEVDSAATNHQRQQRCK